MSDTIISTFPNFDGSTHYATVVDGKVVWKPITPEMNAPPRVYDNTPVTEYQLLTKEEVDTLYKRIRALELAVNKLAGAMKE